MWRYKNYSDYSQVFNARRQDEAHQQYNTKIGSCVNKREKQICLSFTFWGEPPIREPNHIYEMRSYSLKPGTLFEWGNNWYESILYNVFKF